jgi:hypothetical protein
MWNKDGQLVFPETGSGLDILDQGGVLTVAEARPDHSGEWKCIASTAWGQDTIIYWLSVMSRTRLQQHACSEPKVPVIHTIVPVSNSSLELEWDMLDFNSSCFQEFIIFWWSKLPDSSFHNQTVELTQRQTIIHNLVPSVTYYFQVNLVREKDLKDYVYGETKSQVMQFIRGHEEAVTDSDSMAVNLVVIIIIVILVLMLGLFGFIKRRTLIR